jgi:hypothetical protein
LLSVAVVEHHVTNLPCTLRDTVAAVVEHQVELPHRTVVVADMVTGVQVAARTVSVLLVKETLEQ